MMERWHELALGHPHLTLILSTLAIYYVLASLVWALPEPDKSSGKGYITLHTFLHFLAANPQFLSSNFLYALRRKAPDYVMPQEKDAPPKP